MKRFSDFHPEGCLDTDDDVRNFYNSILSCTKTYKRASAYFSQGFYEYISKGLTQLLLNDGSMQLLLSTEIDKESLDEIKKGYSLKENKTDYIIDCIKRGHIDLDNLEISILVYLIAIDKLDIKFVFKEEGLFHDKYAIFTDAYNDELIITGSGNETGASVLKNHESFDVTYTWDGSSKKELKKIADRKKKFEDTWNNKVDDLLVLPMTEVIKEKIIEKFVSKQVNVFTEYKSFVRISIDEEHHIVIQSNNDLSIILNHYLATAINSLIENKTSNMIVLVRDLQFRDIYLISKDLKDICSEYDLRYVITEDLRTYLERNYIDLDSLAVIGNKIKDNNYIVSNHEYLHFRETIQSLVQRPLKDKQILAAYHIVQLKRSMNFSVPGSGKTAAILGAYEYLRSENTEESERIERILVLGPLNCFKAWKEEFEIVSPEYNKDTKAIDIIDISQIGTIGDKNTALKYGGFKKAKLILVNFDIVTSLVNTLQELVDEKTLVVFDEIHRIKNYESEKKNACSKIIDKTKYRIALTGTPLPNGYKDLFTMFNLLYGEYVFNYFGMSQDDLNKADSMFDKNGIESKEINQKIFPFYIRVTKKDLEVPEANKDHLVYVETTSDEKNLYNKILLSDCDSLEKIIRLTQIGCIPRTALQELSEDDKASFGGIESESSSVSEFDVNITSKIEALLKIIEENPCKSIIWCVFTETIEKITFILQERNYKVAKIYGITSNEERSSIIDKFNNTNDINFLITNPHTLAESVSLHKACHRAFYMELNYNLSHYLQSRDRIHRLGLAPGVKTDYYIFVNKYDNEIEKCIDYEIYSRLRKKEQKMIEAIDKGNLIFRETQSISDMNDIINNMTKEN
ncbi:DEAD/DEAH box helicase family protein [bacterium]|nr:DEAD/DEAH box helicase family protein [bacterium]